MHNTSEYNIARLGYCIPACLSSVMKLDYGKDVDQVAIGSRLNLITDSPEDVDLGVRIDLPEFRLLFEEQGVRVSISYIKAVEHDEWLMLDQLESLLAVKGRKVSIILTLSSGILLGHGQNDIGHAVILRSISGDQLEYFDPGPESAGVRVSNFELVYRACRYRNGGALVIASE